MNDTLDKPIEAGNWIVYPHMVGQSAALNLGYVVSVNEDKGTLTIYSMNKWSWEPNVLSDKKITLRKPSATLVIHAQQVPENLRSAVALKILEKDATKTS